MVVSGTIEKDTINHKVQNVLNLLVARSRGEINNNIVEDAVSQLLEKSTTCGLSTNEKDSIHIEEDKDNYDDVESFTKKDKENNNNKEGYIWPGPTVSIKDLRKEAEAGRDPFESIPLGKEGRKMLIAFGDGPSPKPEVVQIVLLGARSLLQAAVKDARAWRRYMKGEFAHAKRSVHAEYNPNRLPKDSKVSKGQERADTSLLYRAFQSRDKLSSNPKCGFDIEQLLQLFPEEINAYNRWYQMHEEYVKQEKQDESMPNKENQESAGKSHIESEVTGGHLKERAQNFDIRTDEMRKEWYLAFSNFRQGSFLPRRSKDDKELNAMQEAQEAMVQKRKRDGNWDRYPPMTIRFLHWIGFDPESALPPPSEDTTGALAFLGYDFMGRIIEKSVQIHIDSAARRKKSLEKGQLKEYTKDLKSRLELPIGEQLTSEDVLKALGDSFVRPASLYSSCTTQKSSTATQLYFGPGFERRLEMELDEMLDSGKKRKLLTEEEIETRKREDLLFENLSKPPRVFDGFYQLFAAGDGDETKLKDLKVDQGKSQKLRHLAKGGK